MVNIHLNSLLILIFKGSKAREPKFINYSFSKKNIKKVMIPIIQTINPNPCYINQVFLTRKKIGSYRSIPSEIKKELNELFIKVYKYSYFIGIFS